MIILSVWNPVFLHTLRLKTYDVFLRQHPGVKTDVPIVIVDIDDKSLSRLGQWPWPRNIIGEIVSFVGKGNPKAIGLDIVFAEPDRLSPKRIASAIDLQNMAASCRSDLDSLPDYDKLLAEALESTPAILGFSFVLNSYATPAGFNSRPCGFAVIGVDPKPWLFTAANGIGNLPVLEKAASGSGFFNILPDEDGVVRKVPLIIGFNEDVYPSLVLEMIRKGEDTATFQIRSGSNGIEYIKLGAHVIPTDAHGRMNIRFCGPEKNFLYISAIDILSERINPAFFQNAYVLVGASAQGILDIVATPTSALFPGVEVHAHAINTILTDSYLLEPDWAKGAEFTYLFAMSILLILLVPAIGATRSGFLFVVTSGGIIFFSYWLFNRYGYFLDLIYPLLCTGLIFTTLTFINYVQEERERRNTRKAFSKYLSPVLVNELLNSPEKLTLSGEERTVTILFSDIRNFTGISEELSPREVCTFLNRYFTAMVEKLMDNGATVDKFIGDAVYAFWNAPLYDNDHARHAVMAALQMREALKELNNTRKADQTPFIETGIGIHTGPVRIGNIGSENRLNYTAIGDSVNLASRLEGVTKVYGVPIIVSATTRQQVKADFVFRKLDRIQVKGKKRPVTIYELIGKKSQVSLKIIHEITQHKEAFDAYLAGDFQTALHLFQQLSGGHYDKLYQLFVTRCRYYLDNPPGESWDGISVILYK